MKYITFILFTAIVITSCDKNETQDTNLITINLILLDNPDFFEKTVILFESDDYLVKTNFETYINEYPFDVLSGYEDIKIKAIADTSIIVTLEMVDYLRKNNDSIYILAHHLEIGKCLIYDKTSDSVIKHIEMEEYLEGEPMQSTGGRRFYINGKLFIETVDFIS